MDYRKTEEIMAWVADYERGDFSVNGDLKLSRGLAERFQRLNERRFLGKRMRYDGQKMYITSGEREGNSFRIPAGAVVYGPYFTFPAGEYRAEFHLAGASDRFTLSVESAGHGTIVQKDCHGVISSVETLPFLLPERIDGLELKLTNKGSESMVFHAVEVSLCGEELSDEEKARHSRHDRETLAAFRAAQMEAESALEPQRQAASCVLPQNTRLRFFKRVIRKLIKPYIAFQILFNNAAAAQNERLTRQMRRVGDFLESVFSRLSRHERRLQEMEQQIVELRAVQALQGGALERQEKVQGQWIKYADDLQRGQSELQRGQSELQRGQSELQRGQNDLQRGQNDLQRGQSELQRGQSELQRGQNDLQRGQSELRNDLDDERLFWKKEQTERQENSAEVQRRLLQLESREEGDSEARKEIGHLWSKVAEFDDNFRSSWQHDQATNNNLNSLWTEQGNLRRELFYELDHRLRGRVHEEVVAEHLIKDSAREKMESGAVIRLNLGSGNLAVDGYLSVDARNLASVDVVADVGDLPFAAGEVDEIYSAHLIEHFTLLRLEKELLPHWFSRLKDGGVIRLVFPDLPAMIAAYNAGDMSFDELGEVIMGGQDYALDYHYAVHSVERVSALLKKTGFRDIRVVEEGRKNGQCRESEITAVK